VSHRATSRALCLVILESGGQSKNDLVIDPIIFSSKSISIDGFWKTP
jgi:hypothetical protein